MPASAVPTWHTTTAAARVPHRIGEFGPLTFQNDDVLRDRLGAERRSHPTAHCRIEPLVNVQDRGALYAYEIVNFVDGKRTVADIRDAVSGELGPIPFEIVSDYLRPARRRKSSGFVESRRYFGGGAPALPRCMPLE